MRAIRCRPPLERHPLQLRWEAASIEASHPDDEDEITPRSHRQWMSPMLRRLSHPKWMRPMPESQVKEELSVKDADPSPTLGDEADTVAVGAEVEFASEVSAEEDGAP